MTRNLNIGLVVILMQAISIIAPVYAEDCNIQSDSDGIWNQVYVASDRLSNLVCHRLKGTSDEDRTTINDVNSDWRTEVLTSAGRIDKALQLTATGLPDENNDGRVAQSMSQLAAMFVVDVEQTLGPVFQIEESDIRKKIVAGGIGMPSISSRDRDKSIIVNTRTELRSNQVRFKIKVTDGMDDNCKAEFGKICIVAVKHWASAVSAYKGSAVRLTADAISEIAVEYSKDWGKFYNEARAQTFLDTFYTASRNTEYLTGNAFVKAPDKQYFLFRPSIVMEYIEDVDDGDRFREALSFEWYGFNYWRGCPIIFDSACGLSLVSTLSDRASADEHSIGLMFHYDNNLSFGVVRGTGEEEDIGYFVTIDLLKAIESKEELARNWKQEVQDKYETLNK